ncbi:MAG: hypothetical protein NC311_10015 [Muribaculaceae bacterium]|nr:hypothetical protein [Muribaculaceae bacterium]
MPSDKITDSMSQLGLLTGSLALGEDPSGILYAVCSGAQILFYDHAWAIRHGIQFESCRLRQYLQETDFSQAAKALSETLAWASIHDAANYMLFLAALEGTAPMGHVLLRPAGGIWPDAAADKIPWSSGAKPASPTDRCFPAIPVLNACSVQAGPEDDPNALLAEAGTDILIRSAGPMGGLMYTGWCSDLDQPASVTAMLADFTKPWKIVVRPDGSEDIMPAHPLRLASAIMGCYEDI